jgi:DNA uptake protein ComE-like DNA-binding protein
MSVTQTGRVLAYRERQGFRSVDELRTIPGFPDGFLDGIRGRLSV